MMATGNLVETLVEVAAESIKNQQAMIVADVGTLRSVTLELELSNVGAVIDSRCYVERRGVHRRKAG